MRAETVVHTIRHGHTRYNAEKRYAGTIDIPLDEKGISDCQQASHTLNGYTFDVVVTSTLRRSLDTARLLLPAHRKIVKTPLCNERNFGVMEGRTWSEILECDPPILMISVGNDLHTVNPSGGEPFEDVWQRAKRFRRYLFRNFEGKSVLVISHGVFLQMFHGVLRGISCIESLAQYPANLELYRFHFVGDDLIDERITKLLDTGAEPAF